MRYHELFENERRSTPVEQPTFAQRFDLIVVGLGAAGSFCALSAAQEGLRVLGLERGSCMGGMSVQGMVNGYYNGYPGGAFEEIDRDTQAMLKRVYTPFHNHPDAKKIRLEQKLLENGVDVRYHAVVLGVYAEAQSVCGVRALIDGAVSDIACRFLCDSTSDGHILRMLPVNLYLGRQSDGSTAPFSSVRLFRQRKEGRFALARTNDDSGYIDPYDDLEFSRRVIEANARHTENCPAQSERLVCLAPQIGVREGMCFEGEETLTLKDVLDERLPERTLVCAYSDIDRHGIDRAFDGETYQDWYVLSNLSTVTMKIRLPLGSIVPKGWKRLVSVSRCLSLDNYASSAVRMNRDMYRLGEAAGVALALAVKKDLDSVLAVAYDALYDRVQARGCFDPRPNETKGFVDPLKTPTYAPVEWLTDVEEIRRQMPGDCPGVALWSIRRLGDGLRETVWQWTQQTEDEQLRLNAALALAAFKDERSLPLLRELVRKRKAYFFQDCRRSNQLRSVIAICYLGRFADAQSVDELLSILKPEEFDRDMYHQYTTPSYKFSIIKRLNTVYYQHVSFAVAALEKIAAAHPELRERIRAEMQAAFADGAYVARMTTGGSDDSYGVVVRNLAKRAMKL